MSRANMWMRPSLGLLCGLAAAGAPSYSWAQSAPAPAPAPAPACPTTPAAKPQTHPAAQHHYALHHHYHHRHHHVYAQGSWNNAAYTSENARSTSALSGQPGGTQIVYGQAIGTQIGHGGRQVILSKGFASSSQIQAGGVQSISPGGSAAGTTVSGVGANQVVSANATSVGGALSDGGTQTVYGHAVDTKIGADSQQTVSAGGVSTNTTATGAGAVQIITSNASSTGSIISNGASQTVYGQSANTQIGVNGQQTISAGGVSTNTTATGAGAVQIVSANAKAVGGLVTDGAKQTVYGQSAHTQIGAMAQQTVSAGGVSTDASAVGNGAVQIVLPGGTAVGTNLAAGATQTVYGTSINAKLGALEGMNAAPQAMPANNTPNNAQPNPAKVAPSASSFVMWTIFSGIPIGQQLQEWGQKSGWAVNWSVRTDPITTGNLYYFSGFENAAKDVVTELNEKGFKVKATFSDATKTLTITQP